MEEEEFHRQKEGLASILAEDRGWGGWRNSLHVGCRLNQLLWDVIDIKLYKHIVYIIHKYIPWMVLKVIGFDPLQLGSTGWNLSRTSSTGPGMEIRMGGGSPWLMLDESTGSHFCMALDGLDR